MYGHLLVETHCKPMQVQCDAKCCARKPNFTKSKLNSHVSPLQARTQGGGFGVQPPPPPWFFFKTCHPGDRSGRRTVPLPNGVARLSTLMALWRKKSVGAPPPAYQLFLGLARLSRLANPPPL